MNNIVKKKNNRESNYELMRLISMFLVVLWHVILHGGFYETTGALKMLLEFIILVGVVHINSFIIVSGYFQCEKKFSWKKFISIFFLTWFYKVIFVIIFKYFDIVTVPKIDLFKELLPIDFKNYWYINIYLVLYLISPWLNKLIKNMNQKEYRKLLIVSFILFSTIPFLTNQSTVANNGYTIIQFVYMYLIGGYLKKYPIEENYHFKIYSNNKKQLIFIFSFCFFLLFNFLMLQFSTSLFSYNNSLLRETAKYISDNNRLYSNPFVIIQSISYFLFFSTLHFKNKVVNYLAKSSLEIYLIHENYYVCTNIYSILNTKQWLKYSNITIITYIFGLTIIFYILCIIISLIRMYLFKGLSKTNLLNKIINNVLVYINNI